MPGRGDRGLNFICGSGGRRVGPEMEVLHWGKGGNYMRECYKCRKGGGDGIFFQANIKAAV